MASDTSKFEKNKQLIALAQSGDGEISMQATQELVVNNMGLLRSIAGRFRDRGTEMEDLIQIGTIGMIKAIRSFELERDTAFSTYAVPLIIGEIRRHLRDDGPMKVSRTQKRLGLELSNLRARILSAEGREPGIEELAKGCGTTPEEAAMALDSIAPVCSLSEPVGSEEGNVTLETKLGDDESDIERLTDSISLGQAISHLPELWRKILLLRYYRDLTQQQTAAILGISQVKVSREEKKIMSALRRELVG